MEYGGLVNMATTTNTQDCVIAGGGPAGMMVGLLLARAGVKVSVLEKHPDFLRDFRGDTMRLSSGFPGCLISLYKSKSE